MLSLKATLKAIGESITTIKSALDGKATKYTGYGTPVTLTTSWYTIPSDGLVRTEVGYGSNYYVHVSVRNYGDTGSEVIFTLATTSASDGSNSNVIPVFKGQQARVYSRSGTSHTSALYYPFV